MFILEAIAAFGNWFWGLPILFLIVGGGIYITIRLGFVQFRKFGYICSQTFGKMFAKAGDGEVSSFSAACGALASSIGASNIVGVPAAVVMGGPGAVFWIWLIALIGCGTKYCEIALAIKYREKNEAGEWVGGAAYYLRALGGGIGKFLGGWYAIGLMIELIPSLCTQALSATSQFIILGVDQKISGAILGILVAVIIAGGVNRVLKITDIMVPVMAILYMAGALVIIIMNAGQILPALGSIFVYAFTPHAAIGGFAGSTIALALRWGAARGVYSNEAGFGTAPTAHATASVDHPIRQAVLGRIRSNGRYSDRMYYYGPSDVDHRYVDYCGLRYWSDSSGGVPQCLRNFRRLLRSYFSIPVRILDPDRMLYVRLETGRILIRTEVLQNLEIYISSVHDHSRVRTGFDHDVHGYRRIPGSYHDSKHDRTDHNGTSGSEAAEGILQYSGQVLLGGQRG